MTSNKKCYIVSYFGLSNIGGVERVCYYLSEIFREKAYDVCVVDRACVESWAPARIYRALLGKVHAALFPVFASWYLRCHKKSGDIVVSNGFNAPFQRSDYWFCHGTLCGYASAARSSDTSWKQRWLVCMERCAARNARMIVAVAHHALAEAERFYLRGKSVRSVVLNNTVDDAVFRPLPRRTESPKPVTVLFCGRLAYPKGEDRLQELARAIERTDGFRFRIATNSREKARCFDGLKHTQVEVGLTLQTLNAFYNSGDVFYFPSRYEGFEMVTLEALSAGIPVLGAPVGAVAELVGRGEPGVRLIPQDPAELLPELQRLAGQYATEAARRELHDYYRERYGIETYKKKLSDIIG